MCRLIDISNSTIADYIVIATANSTVHNKALIDKVETACEAEGQAVLRRDGVADGRWIVLDCGNFLLHTFTPELREFYHLEKIWSDGKNTLDFAGVNNLPEFVPAEAEKEE